MAPWHPPPRVHVLVPLACACPYPSRACAPPSRTRAPLPRVCMPRPLRTCTPALIHPTSPRPAPPCLYFACGQDGAGRTGPGWCARARRAMRVGGAVHKGGSGGARGPCGGCTWGGARGLVRRGCAEGGSGERAEQGAKGWSPGQSRAPPQFAHNWGEGRKRGARASSRSRARPPPARMGTPALLLTWVHPPPARTGAPPLPLGRRGGACRGGRRRGAHGRGTQRGHAEGARREGTRRGGAQRRTQREHAEGGALPLYKPPSVHPSVRPPPLCASSARPTAHRSSARDHSACPPFVPPLCASPLLLAQAPPLPFMHTPRPAHAHRAWVQNRGEGAHRCGRRGRGCGRGPLPHPPSPPSHSPFAGNGVGSAQNWGHG